MLKRLLKPSSIFGLVLCVQLFVLCLFVTGLVPSFTLDAEKVDPIGIVLYFLFSLAALIVLSSLCRVRGEDEGCNDFGPDFVEICDQAKLGAIINFFMLVSLAGSLYLFVNTIQGYGFVDYVSACISNQVKGSLELQTGPVHLFLIFPMANSVLIPLMSGDKWRLPFCGNLLCLVFMATVFGSRILLLECLVCSGIVGCSRIRLKDDLTLRSLMIGVVTVVLAFLIFATTSGLRDYEFEGYLYTDSPIVWGVSRILDYPCSTLIYTSNFLELIMVPGNPLNLFPSLERLGPVAGLLSSTGTTPFLSEYGKAYYTNLGCFPELVHKAGLWAAIVGPFVMFCCARLYASYSRRELIGLIFYPFFLYSLFEYWRTFHLGYELVQVTFVLLFATYFYIRPSRKRNCS